MANTGEYERTRFRNTRQGVHQMHPKESDPGLNDKCNLDVIFVPGLGANPETSWQPKPKDSWNWAFHKDGLLSIFPTARILLFYNESDWKGEYKVHQFLDNLAKLLVESLQNQRGSKLSKRPIVFIGHSMGGLIIAKALCMMQHERALYNDMLQTTTGCVFFGTPFLGTEMAGYASKVANMGQRLNMALNSKLLALMEPEDATLQTLRNDFSKLVAKMNPGIRILVFWEAKETDIEELLEKYVGGAASFILFPFSAGNRGCRIVSQQSATFAESFHDHISLDCNHTWLVKFDSNKDGRFQIVSNPLRRILIDAEKIVNARLKPLNSGRDQIGLDMAKITKVLVGNVDLSLKREAVEAKFGSSSWLPAEASFKTWLALPPKTLDRETTGAVNNNCLWIYGAEGRGKTGASLAAIDQVEINQAKNNSEKKQVLLAHCFCDPTDISTAQDVLKLLIWQLVKEQPLLTTYATQLTGKSRRNVSTIEKLWQVLQDIFSDRIASTRIYIVINNVHCLPGEADSTQKLLELVGEDVQKPSHTDSRTSVRWLITSRKSREDIYERLSGNTNKIDLDEGRYTSKVQSELLKHAQKKVINLSTAKNYKKDLSYFVTSFIGNRAKDSGWIDIAVEQLGTLDMTESSSNIRHKLRAMPRNLDDLLLEAWTRIFQSNHDHINAITEMLRVLVLTHEDPSLEEFSILTGVHDLHKLRSTVELCSFYLLIGAVEGKENVIHFKNSFAKPHLLRHSAELLQMSEDEIALQQGELALRSLDHLFEKYTLKNDDKTEGILMMKREQEQIEEANADHDSDDESSDDESSDESDDEDDDSDDSDYDGEVLEAEALPYMAKHWLRHASKATPDLADELSLDQRLWKKVSLVRQRWLSQYQALSDNFYFQVGISVDKWTALHAASSFGYKELVTALIANGHQDELSIYIHKSLAPIHLAAFFGQYDIVKELMTQGSSVNDAFNSKKETPLAMAALCGHIKVMELLIEAKANINTESGYDGLPLNNAIWSENIDAVQLLVEKGAKIHHEKKHSPLKYAAALPDRKVFDYLLKVGECQLQPNDFGLALKGAAREGNVSILADLLKRKHEKRFIQAALNSASIKQEWGSVRYIMDQQNDLGKFGCDVVIANAAKAAEDSDQLLEFVWKYAAGSISQQALDKALYNATDFEKRSTVQKLLLLHADPNATGSVYGNALTAAAYDGTVEIVDLLIKNGAKVNSSNGWALQTAVGQGHMPVVELLLQKGADVNARARDVRFPQDTALQAAVESCRSEMVDLLLSNNADPNSGAGEYVCPLVAAAIYCKGEMLEQLVERGANVNVDGGAGTTPLISAVRRLPVKYADFLLQKGAEINHRDFEGKTALIWAAEVGDVECVESLLSKNADIRISFNKGKNALQTAFEHQNQDCVKVLIDHFSKLLLGKPQYVHTPVLQRSRIVVVNNSTPIETNDQVQLSLAQKATENPNKWVEAKKNTYDGGDWGTYDNDDVYDSTKALPSNPPAPEYGQIGLSNGPRNYYGDVQVTATGHFTSSNDYPVATYPSPPSLNQDGLPSSRDPNARTPSPRSLPPQNQQYGQNHFQQLQHPYRSPLPSQFSGQWTPAPYSQQNQQQYVQREQEHRTPPPSLTPGHRTPSSSVNQGTFSSFGFFQRQESPGSS